MRNIVLYGHAGSANHGCEALVRTTYQIFRRAGIDSKITVSTLDSSSDLRYGAPADEWIQNDFSYRVGLSYRVLCRIHPNFMGIQNHKARKDYAPFLNYIESRQDDGLYVSIGGDNYCTARPTWMYELNRAIDQKGFPRILWGCSVEPDTISDRMLKDLDGYQLIVARESITYKTLTQRCNTRVVQYSDPAFTLMSKDVALPDEFVPDRTVGINLSPVAVRSEAVQGITLKAYKALMRHILESTDYHIALIPHVTIPEDNDLDVLRQLYDEFQDSGRVCMTGDMNCCQLKYLISKCRLFIGARTHSTIAAYSSCIPAVVVGYSVKARGIANDIFGTYENYVKTVQQLQSENELISSFDWLNEHETEIRERLQEVMPEYTKLSWMAGDEVRGLV